MTAPIRIKIRYFSHLRQRLGRAEETLELPPGYTVRQLDARVRDSAAGRLDGFVFRVAVNQEYVPETRVLAHGDEVALISPVQGG